MQSTLPQLNGEEIEQARVIAARVRRATGREVPNEHLAAAIERGEYDSDVAVQAALEALAATPAPVVNGAAVERAVALAIASELAAQDGEDWSLKADLTLDYLDQGEVDFRRVAQAAIAAMPAGDGEVESDDDK